MIKNYYTDLCIAQKIVRIGPVLEAVFKHIYLEFISRHYLSKTNKHAESKLGTWYVHKCLASMPTGLGQLSTLKSPPVSV